MASAWHDRDACHAVFEAAYREDVDAVCAAISGGFPPSAVDHDGKTLLHHAARHLAALVPLLVEHGWDVNARDAYGIAPVHYACWSGKLDTVQVLVQAGASLEATDSRGWTVAHYTAYDYDLDDTSTRLRLFKWLATRPEVDWCYETKVTETVFLRLARLASFTHQPVYQRYKDIVTGAMAAQRTREARWTPLRAAFVGAAVGEHGWGACQ
jgi:hypothetical protein